MCTFFLEKQEETRAVESISKWKISIFFFVELAFGCLLFFGRGRNAVFTVFHLSAVAETLFSLFFIFRPWPKRCFRCFLSFGRGRNAVFVVFYLSAVAEMQFSGVFDFPKVGKHSF